MDDLLLYGPPGTGKTTTGIEWLGDRVTEGANLYSAAFVSFTNAAVDEAKERLSQRFSVDAQELPYSRTLHSLCKHVLGITEKEWLADDKLEEFAEEFGYDLKKARRSGNDEDDLETTAEKTGADAPLLKIWDFARHRLIEDYQEAWQEFAGYDPEGVAFAPAGRFCAIVKDYERWKRRERLWDYTDLLLEYLRDPRPLPVSVAVVDECQDLSPLMWQVADHLFAEAEFRATLGDDDQAIYSFSGAEPTLMNRRPARVKQKLVQSYRLPRRVTEAALSIIEQNENREPKEIRSKDEEGLAERAYFLEDLDMLNGESWYVLVRNWRLLEQVQPVLEEEGIPYRVGGGRRYTPWSDRGPLRAVRTLLRLAGGETVTMGELWPLVQKTSSQRGAKVGTWAFGQKKRLEDMAANDSASSVTWRDLPALGMTAWGIEKVIRRDFSMLTRDVSERDLRAYENAKKRGTLDRQVSLTLNSGHGAKGKEADNVVALMACTAGPARSLLRPWRAEEERRVAYVMATRAKHRFYGLTVPPSEGLHPWEVLGL